VKDSDIVKWWLRAKRWYHVPFPFH
jgi:hypothetical protein